MDLIKGIVSLSEVKAVLTCLRSEGAVSSKFLQDKVVAAEKDIEDLRQSIVDAMPISSIPVNAKLEVNKLTNEYEDIQEYIHNSKFIQSLDYEYLNRNHSQEFLDKYEKCMEYLKDKA